MTVHWILNSLKQIPDIVILTFLGLVVPFF